MEVLLDLLQSFGFPAFMCFMMFRYLESTDDKREAHNLENIKAINRNTVVLAEICSKMDIQFPVDEEDVS